MSPASIYKPWSIPLVDVETDHCFSFDGHAMRQLIEAFR